MHPDRLIFGTASLHRLFVPSARRDLLRRALDVGFRRFDTAPSYGNGLGEATLGEVLDGHVDVAISTKFGIPFNDYGARHPVAFPVFRLAHKTRPGRYRDEQRQRDWSTRSLRESVAASLRRLRQDAIDTLLIHEPVAPLDLTTIDALSGEASVLRDAGVLRDLGIAGPMSVIAPVASHRSLGVLQAPYDDAIDLATRTSRPVVAYGAYSAYRRSHATGRSFGDVVLDALERYPQLRIVVASTQSTVVSALGRLIRG